MKKEDERPTSFLIPMWEWIFMLLEKISVFYVIRKTMPSLRKKYWFVDAWVVGNLLFAFASVYIVSYEQTPRVLVYIIVAYGILRVFEIFVYQMNVLLVHPFKGGGLNPYILHSYRRMIVALIHNFSSFGLRQLMWRSSSHLSIRWNG